MPAADVNNALIQWQTARQRQQIDQQQILSLESTVRSSELLMQYSSQNYLEVLTARQTLLQAELTAVSDRFDEIQGVINPLPRLGRRSGSNILVKHIHNTGRNLKGLRLYVLWGIVYDVSEEMERDSEAGHYDRHHRHQL